MASKSGKGRRSYQDAVDSLHNDTSLTDYETDAIRKVMIEGVRALGGTDRFLDRTITANYDFYRGTSPSLAVSIVVT